MLSFLGMSFYAFDVAPVHLRGSVAGSSTAASWMFEFGSWGDRSRFFSISYKWFILYATINALRMPKVSFHILKQVESHRRRLRKCFWLRRQYFSWSPSILRSEAGTPIQRHPRSSNRYILKVARPSEDGSPKKSNSSKHKQGARGFFDRDEDWDKLERTENISWNIVVFPHELFELWFGP